MKIEKTIIDVLKAPGQDSTPLSPATPVRTPPWPGAEWKATTHRWVGSKTQAAKDKKTRGDKRMKGHSKKSPQWLKHLLSGRRGGASMPTRSNKAGETPIQHVSTPKEKTTKHKKTKSKEAK